jgi:hypothetical protein
MTSMPVGQKDKPLETQKQGKGNLGQKEAELGKQKDSQLSGMSEKSREPASGTRTSEPATRRARALAIQESCPIYSPSARAECDERGRFKSTKKHEGNLHIDGKDG